MQTNQHEAAGVDRSDQAAQPLDPWDLAVVSNKLRLLGALQQCGAIDARVQYSGSSDEGGVTDVTLSGVAEASERLGDAVEMLVQDSRYIEGKWTQKIQAESMTLSEALREFATEALGRHHRGYEINDGGAGEVVFLPQEKVVRIEHYDYYTESDYTETEL